MPKKQIQTMGRLDGKVAVITGGTSGIGRETVNLFIQEGAKVVFCGRGEEVGQQIAAENGANCVFVKADVTIEDDIKLVIDTAIERFGELHCLFK